MAKRSEKPEKTGSSRKRIALDIWEAEIQALFERRNCRLGPQQIAEGIQKPMEKLRRSSEKISRQTILPHLQRMVKKGILFSKDGLYSIEQPMEEERVILEKIYEKIESLEKDIERFEMPEKITIERSTVATIIKETASELDPVKVINRMVSMKHLFEQDEPGGPRYSIGPYGFIELMKCEKCHKKLDGGDDLVLRTGSSVICTSCAEDRFGMMPGQIKCGHCGLPLQKSISPSLRVVHILPGLLNDREIHAYLTMFETDTPGYFASGATNAEIARLRTEEFTIGDADWNGYLISGFLDLIYKAMDAGYRDYWEKKDLTRDQVETIGHRRSELEIAVWKKISAIDEQLQHSCISALYGEIGQLWAQVGYLPMRSKDGKYYHPLCFDNRSSSMKHLDRGSG